MKKLSSQRSWQIKQIKKGYCKLCKKARVDALHCAFHKEQARKQNLARYHKRKKKLDAMG